MIRVGAVMLAALWGHVALAQDGPRVSVTSSADETVLGQPIVVRVRVLVPSFMPEPPEFPDFDVPGLVVRLPERAGGPVSEQVDGETWSGVERAYRIYPLQPGDFDLGGQTVQVTYADPDASNTSTVALDLEAIGFSATVPDAARGLDPLIVAQGFGLAAEVEGGVEDDAAVEVGSAVTRVVTAQIAGTTPILIPALNPPLGTDRLRAYPDEPKVTETEDRGVLSGSRSERTVYVATAPGAAELPAISIDWFNLDTGQVETAQLPAIALSISAGPEQGTGGSRAMDVRIVLAILLLLLLAGALRFFWPALTARFEDLRQRWHASPAYAARKVRRAIRARDLGRTYQALTGWTQVQKNADPEALHTALSALGAQDFGRDRSAPAAQGWADLDRAFRHARSAARGKTRKAGAADQLARLNP